MMCCQLKVLFIYLFSERLFITTLNLYEESSYEY